MVDDQLPPLFYTDKTNEFLNTVFDKKNKRKQTSLVSKDKAEIKTLFKKI